MNIQVEDLVLGEGAFVHPTAVIRGLSGKARRVVLGDFCYIGADVQILCDDFSLGDYGKVHHHTTIHGYQPCNIGHNAWVGQFSIIDSIGGVEIGDNCGIGAHSQLWSHIKFGDTLEGCQFSSTKKLTVGKDVWFVGHCIVSPVTVADRAMVLVGSVVTKDLAYNKLYAGSPAVELPGKSQFKQVCPEAKLEALQNHLLASGVNQENIRLVISESDMDLDDDITYFAVSTRTYTKKRNPDEVEFMKYLLPEKGKFTPFSR